MRPATWLALGAWALLILATGSSARADSQEADAGNAKYEPLRGPTVGLGLTLGVGSMSVGSDSSMRFAAGLAARIGLGPGNRLQLMAEFQPMKVESPIIDESFTTLNLLAGVSIGRSFRVRPAIGVQYRYWSGSQRVVDRDSALLLGLDAGQALRLSDRLSISPELVLRWSLIELEGSVGSRFVGFQCVLSWGRAPS